MKAGRQASAVTSRFAAVGRLQGMDTKHPFEKVVTACATNPLPVIVPCHRVLKSDGTPGGYVGGPEAKLALLSLEAAA